MLPMLDLERLRATPLTREPFEFLIVPEFVKAHARSAIHTDYPEVNRPGSFPLGEVSYGSAFAKLIEQMRSDEFRNAFEEKFGTRPEESARHDHRARPLQRKGWQNTHRLGHEDHNDTNLHEPRVGI